MVEPGSSATAASDVPSICLRCGYDLRGLAGSGRCPECGAGAVAFDWHEAAGNLAGSIGLLAISFLFESIIFCALLVPAMLIFRVLAVWELMRERGLRHVPRLRRPVIVLLIATIAQCLLACALVAAFFVSANRWIVLDVPERLIVPALGLLELIAVLSTLALGARLSAACNEWERTMWLRFLVCAVAAMFVAAGVLGARTIVDGWAATVVIAWFATMILVSYSMFDVAMGVEASVRRGCNPLIESLPG